MVTMFARVVLVVYWCTLTILLLIPNPTRVTDFIPTNRGQHFVAFFTLAVLVYMARLPGKLWKVVLLLLIYGVVVESLQAVVPNRAVELLDYIENITGVAISIGVCWGFSRYYLKRRSAQCVVAVTSTEDEVVSDGIS